MAIGTAVVKADCKSTVLMVLEEVAGVGRVLPSCVSAR